MINSKFIFIIFLPLVSPQCGTRPEYDNHKLGNSIVGGCLASPGEFPWQGVLQATYSNGTVNIYPIVLISQNYAIIYGNNFTDDNPKKLLASFGSVDRENMTQNFDVTPSPVTFTSNTTINLLKLNSSITFGPYIQPICMPRSDTYFINKTAIVSGWGSLDQAARCKFNDTNSKKVSQQGDSSRYLIAASVPTLFDYNGCMQKLVDEGLPTPTTKYGYYYDICAGSNQAGGTIKDQGSPLQMEDSYGRWFLVGLQEEAFVKNQSEVFDQSIILRLEKDENECSYFVTLSYGDFNCSDPNVVTSTTPQKSSTMEGTKISTLSSPGTTPSTAISSTTSLSTSSSTTTSLFTILSSTIRSSTTVSSTTKPSTTISSTISQSTIFSTTNPSTTISSTSSESTVSPTDSQSTIIFTTNPSTAISSSPHNSNTISPTKIFSTFKPPTTISSIAESSTKERSSSKSHKLTTNWWILLILSFSFLINE